MTVNPRVFFDITIGGIQQDRIEIDLYRNEVPLVAENFRILCTKDKPVSFKDSIFPYIIPDFVCQGGNLKESDGTRFGSIYGDKFPDVEMSGRRHRPFDLITAHAVPKIPRKHTGPYPYTCGSQFFICFKTAPILDDGHVVFGTVATGRNTVLNMSDVGSPSGIPTQVVKVVDCGQIW
jgi:cyclophilin family peptidyl-prolyl cis-trans isomerase